MTRQTLQWTLALTVLVAMSYAASAQTVISFKKLNSGDAGDTSTPNTMDAAAGFTDILQDAVVGHGIDPGGLGGVLGQGDLARLNSGARNGDTLGAFGNINLSALMKFNPNAVSTDGSSTPMPAPGEIISATLRLTWIGSLFSGNPDNNGSDFVMAALVSDASNSINANTYFGDMAEAANSAGVALGITGENGFNNGVCDTVTTCGPKDQRDFFSNAADTLHFDMTQFPNPEGERFTIDHDVTALFDSGALTGNGIYIGRIGQDRVNGSNLRLSEDSTVADRPMLILTIPEPASVALLALGGLALLPRRRR
ncbi:MAG: hypothetical protein CMJ18_10630 [Phycisphaeraceae bacterium]|nr:hypothetical protein [Phycisphaeraceae bacterium]